MTIKYIKETSFGRRWNSTRAYMLYVGIIQIFEEFIIIIIHVNAHIDASTVSCLYQLIAFSSTSNNKVLLGGSPDDLSLPYLQQHNGYVTNIKRSNTFWQQYSIIGLCQWRRHDKHSHDVQGHPYRVDGFQVLYLVYTSLHITYTSSFNKLIMMTRCEIFSIQNLAQRNHLPIWLFTYLT